MEYIEKYLKIAGKRNGGQVLQGIFIEKSLKIFSITNRLNSCNFVKATSDSVDSSNPDPLV